MLNDNRLIKNNKKLPCFLYIAPIITRHPLFDLHTVKKLLTVLCLSRLTRQIFTPLGFGPFYPLWLRWSTEFGAQLVDEAHDFGVVLVLGNISRVLCHILEGTLHLRILQVHMNKQGHLYSMDYSMALNTKS